MRNNNPHAMKNWESALSQLEAKWVKDLRLDGWQIYWVEADKPGKVVLVASHPAAGFAFSDDTDKVDPNIQGATESVIDWARRQTTSIQ